MFCYSQEHLSYNQAQEILWQFVMILIMAFQESRNGYIGIWRVRIIFSILLILHLNELN